MRKPAAIAATTALIATSFAACEDTIAYAAPCPSVMTFAVGGTGDPGAQHVPGVSGPVTRVHYSASIAPVGNVGGDASLAEGRRNLNAAARSFRQRCPNSSIRVIGNSMGAWVAGDVRDQWQHDPTMRRNTSFTLVSDPRAKQGVVAMIPSLVPGLTMTGPRPHSTIPTSTICRPTDAICAIGNPLQNPGHAINAVVGYFAGDHGYSSREVTHRPGQHTVAPKTRVVPSTPIPWQPPTPQQVLEPIVQAIVPDAPITPQYTPTPIKAYVPPAVKHLVPRELGNIVLPPVRLPRL